MVSADVFAMKNACRVVATLVLPTIALVGCDFFDSNLPDAIQKQDHQNITDSSLSEESIDLTISPKMIEQLQPQDSDFLAPVETPSTAFEKSPQDDGVGFSGKIHLDESGEDYLDAVDGAEINIEIKFE